MRVMQAESTIQGYIARYEMATFLNEELLSHLQLFHFPAYSNIYVQQDEQHFLYFLVEGQVQCAHYHLNGKLAVISMINPFAAVGDIEVLNKERLKHNVIAVRDSVMLGIPSEVVQCHGVDDPRFLRFLIDQLREKLYKTNALQVNQLLPVINRLALYILAHAEKQEQHVILPGKEDLASLLGTTPRHLNRVLKELVESGGISAGYPFVRILNRQVLENFAC